MKRLAAAVLLEIVTMASPLHATVYKLYYLGGQSNMDGFGSVSELPAELKTAPAGVMI